MAAMQKDKKNRGGKLRFVSMTALGKAVTTDGVEAAMVEALWKRIGAE
jgi:3-dehydroquinate synthetase